MIISSSRHFIFVHIHKTAGEAIKASLAPCLDMKHDVCLVDDFHDWINRLHHPTAHRAILGLGKHSTAAAIRRSIGAASWGSYEAFSVVRDPVARIFSLYRYAKFMGRQRRKLLPRNLWHLTPAGRPGDPLRWPAVRAALETTTFSEFIRHPALARDAAIRPQAEFLCDSNGDFLVTTLLRQEHLAEDFANFTARLALPPLTLLTRNTSPSSGHESQLLPPADLAYLHEQYAIDYRILADLDRRASRA